MRNAFSAPRPWVRTAVAAAAMLGCSVVTATAADDQPMIDPDATQVLTEMSQYLNSLTAFSANYDVSTDVITQEGQKLKLARSGSILLNRPGQLRVVNHGAQAEVEVILDGDVLTLFGNKTNGYLQLPAASVNDALTVLRDDIGFDVPGADILSDAPLHLDQTDVISGVHVGMTAIKGEPVHHLAFRGNEVDWQLWVKDGDTPLPVQYVITSKRLAGGPEYSMLVSDWNTEPMIDATTFSFTPPEAAKELSSISIDPAGNFSDTSE